MLFRSPRGAAGPPGHGRGASRSRRGNSGRRWSIALRRGSNGGRQKGNLNKGDPSGNAPLVAPSALPLRGTPDEAHATPLCGTCQIESDKSISRLYIGAAGRESPVLKRAEREGNISWPTLGGLVLRATETLCLPRFFFSRCRRSSRHLRFSRHLRSSRHLRWFSRQLRTRWRPVARTGSFLVRLCRRPRRRPAETLEPAPRGWHISI